MGRVRRPEYEVFALNIKTIYKAWKLTEETLGELLGVSRSTVSNWTTAYSLPAFHEMRAIERFSGFSEVELRSDFVNRNAIPKQPLQTIEIGPRALAEPSPSYGGGVGEKSVPLLAAPGLEARLERIEAAQREQQRLLLEILRKLETMSAK